MDIKKIPRKNFSKAGGVHVHRPISAYLNINPKGMIEVIEYGCFCGVRGRKAGNAIEWEKKGKSK
jgi:hypothetical protein